MSSVPRGGPGNINGINYQMLWALLTLGSFKAEANQATDGSITEVTLVLEPSRGGDQQQLLSDKRVVVQLKARSGGGTWSLQEIVSDVLPDLYRLSTQTRQSSTSSSQRERGANGIRSKSSSSP